MTLIGRTLSEARDMLDGYDVEVIENISDKQEHYDSILVTNAVIEGNRARLTVSTFLINID